jgi:hypothetical protein
MNTAFLNLADELEQPAGLSQMPLYRPYSRQNGLPADVLASLDPELQERFRNGEAVITRTPGDVLLIREYVGIDVDLI